MGSSDTRKHEPKPEQVAVERAIAATAGEIHMGQYPIFCITTNKPTDTRMTYRETIKVGNVEVLKEWTVQVTAHYGWPGEHEAEVWRSIQHIAELRARDDELTNPVQTTLEEIRNHMSSKSKGGQQRAAIERSLHCLCDTRLETNYWYDASKKNRDSAHFAIIASLSIEERELPNGKKVTDKIYVGFGPELFRNLQSRYVRPLDKGFLDTKLDRWLSKRLYELLGVKFYGLRKKGVPYRTRYSRLCGLLGARKQQYLSDARRILGRAHEELQTHGFLAKIEWWPILKDKRDWVLHYWPGPRAKSEWKKSFWWKDFESRSPLYTEEPPAMGPGPVYVEEPPSNESRILAEVVTDRPEELPIVVVGEVVQARPKQLPLIVEEPPDFPPASAAPAVAQHQGKRAAAKAAPAPSDPAPELVLAPRSSPQAGALAEGLEPYARMAVEAFERATGKHRRIPGLTEAEHRHLSGWESDGVSAADIERGTHEALSQQAARAAESGRRGREIVSLAYVSGQVRDHCARRQTQEQQARLAALERGAFHLARLNQASHLKTAEAKMRNAFLANGYRPDLKTSLLDQLVLVERSPQAAILLASSEEVIELIRAWWQRALSEAAGRPVQILSPAQWVEQFGAAGGAAKRL